ncbi:MAG: NADH-quinone oxidoreductase subunit NuoH [Pirellulaceae bacterium]|nr:NADH-quinone oxidoreductase subunit NuoH [Pirellulaceae bacterium]
MVGLFGLSWPEDSWFGYTIAAVIQCILLLHVVAVGALVFIWMERKVSGRIQDRLGPTRVGGKFGWLQTLADGLKLITKEDIIPRDADRLLFRLAPYVSFAASFAAFLALPFANGWVGQEVNTAVFFILAVLGLEVFGVILAGYASGSKWSLFGAMREAAQVVSYEVPMGLCVVVPVMICGTMNLVTIGNMQAGLFTNWLVFHDPFTFLVFWVYFTCATASVNRAPFDLAEAESELVAGFHTEYSGLRWSFFFMAEYGSMFLVSGLATILFLGAWNGPLPIFLPLADGPLWIVSNLAGCANFIFKAVLLVTVMMWVRWTLPRLRIDQVMTTCLKYCVPIAAFCFLGALAWQLLGVPSPNDLLPVAGKGRWAVRENWVIQSEAVAGDSSGPPAAEEAAKLTRTEG